MLNVHSLQTLPSIEDLKAPIKIWQRFSNARSIEIDLSNCGKNVSIYCIPLISMINQLSIFKNVQDILACINEEYTEMLTAILEKCKNKVSKLQIECGQTYSTSNNDSIILHLPQVQWITILQFFKYWIKWSSKCQTLHLSMYAVGDHIENKNAFLTISKQLCQYIIDNCDCSGIQLLSLRQVQFPFLHKKCNDYVYDDHDDSDNNKLLFKRFVEKFTKLKYFAYHLNNNDDDNDNKTQHGLEFRKLLQPIL